MSFLVIHGTRQYISKMYKHLRKEHPSTRKRMRAIMGNSLKHLTHELKKG